MDPKDVNRINYNNYYVGQNLDFLIRSKMRSESLSTPLTNTPIFYDDQVSSKMALLGKRGFYDPGYIYGFDNPKNEIRENINNQSKNSPPKIPYNYNEREQYMNNQNQRDNYSKEEYEMEMRRQQELEKNKMINQESEQYNNSRNIRPPNYDNEPNRYEERNYQNEIRQQNYNEPNIKENDYRRNEEFQKEYMEYLKNKEYNQRLEEQNNIRGGDNELNLPKTREQIQHDVYIENFKRQQLAKQMMMEDEMKYRQQYNNK